MVSRQEGQHQGRRQQLRRARDFLLRLHKRGQLLILLRTKPIISESSLRWQNGGSLLDPGLHSRSEFFTRFVESARG